MGNPIKPTDDASAPSASARGEHLQQIIRTGKGRDKFFAILGGTLIALSLGTLAVLIIDLMIDGGPHLFHKHYVAENGQPPKINSLVGTLTKKPAPPATQPAAGATAAAAAASAPAWEFKPDVLDVDVSRLADKNSLAIDAIPGFLKPFANQRVAVTGLIPDPGGSALEIETIKLLPAADDAGKPGAKLARGELVGLFKPAKEAIGGAAAEGPAWTFEAESVLLDAAKLDGGAERLASFDGQHVAVTPHRALGSKWQVGSMPTSDITNLRAKSFLFSMPGSSAARAGIFSAWVGSLLVMVATMLTTLPLGVAAGVYLEEYAPKNRLTALIEINIANLAGVPSIVWGLLGLGIFVQGLSVGGQQLTPSLGKTILVAGLTLGLLVLPIVIISTREAIRAIPGTIRDASFALGATKWQTTRFHVLPYSMGGILTGSIVALSRAIGETAPLIVIGAVTYLSFLPPPPLEYRADNQTPPAVAQADAGAGTAGPAAPVAPSGEKSWHFQPFAWLNAAFTVLPIQMFDWTSRPQHAFHQNAAAAGLLLIAMTLLLNSAAIWLRARLRKKIKW